MDIVYLLLVALLLAISVGLVRLATRLGVRGQEDRP